MFMQTIAKLSRFPFVGAGLLHPNLSSAPGYKSLDVSNIYIAVNMVFLPFTHIFLVLCNFWMTVFVVSFSCNSGSWVHLIHVTRSPSCMHALRPRRRQHAISLGHDPSSAWPRSQHPQLAKVFPSGIFLVPEMGENSRGWEFFGEMDKRSEIEKIWMLKTRISGWYVYKSWHWAWTGISCTTMGLAVSWTIPPKWLQAAPGSWAIQWTDGLSLSFPA